MCPKLQPLGLNRLYSYVSPSEKMKLVLWQPTSCKLPLLSLLPYPNPPSQLSLIPQPIPSSASLVGVSTSASSRREEWSHRCKGMACASAMGASEASSLPSNPRPFSVLFVCLGNICRSPTAEAVFRHAVQKRGLESDFNIDSAGTTNYHEGEPADSRMKAAALKRGTNLTSLSRPIRPSDFRDFDMILAMDEQNRVDILKAYDNWSKRQDMPSNGKDKVKLICSYCKTYKETEVPDPYYGGRAGFEKVLDLLEDACESLLDSILAANAV